MLLHQGLAVLVIMVGADGSVETDHELDQARAVFAREFPDVVPVIDVEYEVVES